MSSLMKYIKHVFVKQPLISNCLVYGSLYVGSELTQQVVSRKILSKPPQPLDTGVLTRFAIMGTFVSSPIMFFWYRWMDKVLPGSSKSTIVKKLLIDQFLLSPAMLSLFFVGMSLMEGANDPLKECREKFGSTIFKSVAFWFPVQTINFAYVNPHYRVVYIGICALVWVNILCWIKRQKTTTT